MGQASLEFFDKGDAAYFHVHIQLFMLEVPVILTRNKRHFCIAVKDRIFGGMQEFDFAQI